MQTVTVPLADGRDYPIYIGDQLLERCAELIPPLRGKQVLIVSNTTVAPLYLDKVRQAFSAYQVDTVILPDGEAYKNLDTLNTIYTHLLERRYNRTTTLVALGGGVVGDMTGFAAASYQRGVDFIQIPTTLLAQVDSSVGGKTGVNHALGKNMIGAFHQPRCVIADAATLNTLNDRELSAGLAEVIKYGLIRDPAFFEWLEASMPSLLARDPVALAYAIRRSCEIKADVVGEDETEAGVRAILNLGHTFGHAIETAMGYGEWLHGEAVGAGMALAARLSNRLGWISEDWLVRTLGLIKAANLPLDPPEHMTASEFVRLMAVDKKNIDQRLRLVLLKPVGQALVTAEVPIEQVEAVLTP